MALVGVAVWMDAAAASSVITLVLPYFNRPEATDAALLHHAKLYPDFDMEVVIVDDGSDEPYYAPPKMPWRVIVKRLPKKAAPKNPCMPFNIGVHLASGKHVALSNPEIIHRSSVLPEMVRSLESADYVSAACWCPDNNRWHAHSTRTPLMADKTPIEMPKGAQFHFLAVMERKTFKEIGGFDNEYRDGAGYDDNDLLMRLDQFGASFLQRDDLVVEHSRHGARAAWTPQMFARNREIFMRKWQ
jgi:hypothetical protein